MLNRHRADIGAIAAYIAGGGLALIFAFVAMLVPKYSPIILGASGALISVAGLIRIIANPTPTNSITLTDRNTGSTVSVRTVDTPTPAAKT